MRGRAPLLSTTMLSGMLGASFLALASAQAPVHAQPSSVLVGTPTPNLPAVDGVNGTFQPFGGSLDGRGNHGVTGTLAIPLGHNYGFQIDGLASLLDDRFLGGIGGHLFWRDPSVGLLGLYASHTRYHRFGGAHVNHAAVEFERYMGRWSLQGIVGVEWGSSFRPSGTVVPIDTIDSVPFRGFSIPTRFFDKINLNYYLTDNSMLTVGHRYTGGKHALALGGEWAVPLSSNTMGALFVEGRVGEKNYRAFWMGVRLYHGRSDKALIRRHREDDPINWMPETVFGLLNNSLRGIACPPDTFFDSSAGECLVNDPE